MHPALRRIFFLIIFLAFSFSTIPTLQAQSFEEGLKYYQQENYREALDVFNQITTPQGYLFTAKSLYALRQYREAQANLNNIPEDAPPALYYEAQYTSALVNFQQKKFSEALSKLYNVYNAGLSGDLNFNANQLYGQILNYLTGPQRLAAMRNITAPEVKFDLLESGLGKIPYSEARQLYEVFVESTDNDEWSDKASEFESSLRNQQAYREKYGQSVNQLEPPTGTVYTLNVALPAFQPQESEFEIVKTLYFGAVLAVDEYNDQNRNTKAYINFTNTDGSSEIRSDLQRFVNEQYGDAVIGPLFSNQAKSMVPLVTELQLPTIAPLANDNLNAQNSYLFQANPTFTLHGKQMARYAINELGLNNFGIIAQRNSNGATSAEAFRDEAESLGARITHYFIEDLQTNQYAISNYTSRFGSASRPIEAVYAPFTGRSALTLIDLLIRDLRSMNNAGLTILGSQEYQNLDFRSSKYQNLELYFSSSTYQTNRSVQLSRFKNDYKRKFGTTGNQYSMIGYDVTRFILNALQKVGNPQLLRSALLNYPEYRGLVRNIHFDGGNVNKAVGIFGISSGNITKKK